MSELIKNKFLENHSSKFKLEIGTLDNGKNKKIYLSFYPAITDSERSEIKKTNSNIDVNKIVYNNDKTKVTSIFLPLEEASWLNLYLKLYNAGGENGVKIFFERLKAVNKNFVDYPDKNSSEFIAIKQRIHFYHKTATDTKNIFIGLLEKTKTPFIQIKSVKGNYVLFPIGNADLFQTVLDQVIIDTLNYEKENSFINKLKSSVISSIKAARIQKPKVSDELTKFTNEINNAL